MNSKRLLIFSLLALNLSAGCHRVPPRGKEPGQSVKTYTEAELNKLLVPGMSAVEVTNRFGPPGSSVKIGGQSVLLVYSFPLEHKSADLHLAGFSVYVKNGTVIRWSPIMGESRQTFHVGTPQGSSNERSFEVLLATGSLTNVAQMVDTKGSADATEIKAAPDMTFKANVYAGRSGSERPGEQTVVLVMSDQDASKLKKLTEENFGKRLLIICQNRVVAAPAISAPLVSRQVTFTIKDPSVLSGLHD